MTYSVLFWFVSILRRFAHRQQFLNPVVSMFIFLPCPRKVKGMLISFGFFFNLTPSFHDYFDFSLRTFG